MFRTRRATVAADALTRAHENLATIKVRGGEADGPAG